MPISSQVPIIGYVANGVTKSFSFPFAILSADDLKVKVGADVVTTGFSIAGVGDRDGGSVTFTDAPASLTPIILYREVTLDRATDYQENGDLLAIVLDDDFDRVWMALQDQLLLADRAVRAPIGETLQQLPPASERALMALAFDAAGNPIVVRGTNDGGAALALDLMDTAPGKGAALVGYDDGTVQAVLDDAKPMANYTALRAYTGRATGVRITQAGLAGFFQRDDSDTTSSDNGGTVIVDAAGRRWKRIFDGAVNVQWFGANQGVDSTAAFVAALAAAPLVFVPAGTWVTSRADTDRLLGPGVLKSYAGSPRSTYVSLRKDPTDGARPRQPFEDEFSPHATVDGVDLYYTAFSSGCMVDGIEVYAARTGYEHTSNFTKKCVLHLYLFDRTGNPVISKAAIYTTTTNEDIRDVNICPHPSRAGFVLVSFAEALSGGGYQTRLITYNVRTASVDSSRLLSGIPSTEFKWGNALITPQGHLMFCSYSAGGTDIKIWRSTAQLPTSGAVTMALAYTFTDTFSSEPTIGYWQDKLVIFWRRTGAASRVGYTYDKEGAGPWATPVFPYGASAHSPALLPYSNAQVFTAFFALGTDRSYLGAASSQDLVNFKGETPFRVTGGAIGGYPAIIDCGGYYATCTYAETYDEPGQLIRTRFDRLEIDKGRVDIGPSDPERMTTITLPAATPVGQTGAWVGTPYGPSGRLATDARGYEVEFTVTRSMTIDAVSLLIAGTAGTTVEIYEDGTLVKTSNTLALSASAPTAAVYVLPSSQVLTPLKKYRVKVAGSAAVTMYDIRHNSRTNTVVKCDPISITGLLFGATNYISQSAVSLALRLVL